MLVVVASCVIENKLITGVGKHSGHTFAMDFKFQTEKRIGFSPRQLEKS